MILAGLDFETANGNAGSICAAGCAVLEDGIPIERKRWLIRPHCSMDWMAGFCYCCNPMDSGENCISENFFSFETRRHAWHVSAARRLSRSKRRIISANPACLFRLFSPRRNVSSAFCVRTREFIRVFGPAKTGISRGTHFECRRIRQFLWHTL